MADTNLECSHRIQTWSAATEEDGLLDIYSKTNGMASISCFSKRYLRINCLGADVRFSRGAHVEQLLEGMSDIKEFQGVVLHAGTNNLPDETSEKVIGRFEKLLFEIRNKNPDIQVFVSAILPRDVNLFPGAVNKLKFLDRCNEREKEVNAGLLSMKDVVAIEHPRFGSDRSSANRFLLSKDGLHLTTDGMLEMKRDIETAVRFRLKPMPIPVPRIYRPVSTPPVSFNVPSTVKDVPYFSDLDFPALQTQKKDVPTKKEEVPTQKKDVPTKKEEVPTKKKEVPTNKKKVPTQKQEVPTKKKEVPTQKKEVSTQKKEVSTQKKNVPTFSLIT